MQMALAGSRLFCFNLLNGNGYIIRRLPRGANGTVISGDPCQVQSSHRRKNHSVKDGETLMGTHVWAQVKAVGRTPGGVKL